MGTQPMAFSGVIGQAGRVGGARGAPVNSAELRIRGRRLALVSPARVYVCGITPYDVTHVGHAATFVWADAAAAVIRSGPAGAQTPGTTRPLVMKRL